MTKYNARWAILCKQLTQVERDADILAQSNDRLVKDNIAWAQAYNNLAANHSELLSLYNSLLEKSKFNDCQGTSAEH